MQWYPQQDEMVSKSGDKLVSPTTSSSKHRTEWLDTSPLQEAGFLPSTWQLLPDIWAILYEDLGQDVRVLKFHWLGGMRLQASVKWSLSTFLLVVVYQIYDSVLWPSPTDKFGLTNISGRASKSACCPAGRSGLVLRWLKLHVLRNMR